MTRFACANALHDNLLADVPAMKLGGTIGFIIEQI